MDIKIQKSPLRYPGGKSRAVGYILGLIPQDTKEMVCPFMGGGSIELACASLGIKVHAYDLFKPLVYFWKSLIKDSKQLAKEVYQYHPISKNKFYELQKKIMKSNKKEQAIMFFVLNRTSFSGSTLSGGMSPNHPRFNPSSIERINNFKIKNLTVDLMDFKESLKKHPDILAYLDPPYLIKNTLYGNKGDTHRGFDHQGLFEILKHRKKWILSYNDSPEIRELYRDFKIVTPNWKYGMSTDKSSKEVIILSPDLANQA